MNRIDKNGIIYSGQFLNDNNNDYILHGKGEVLMPTGIKYIGYFIYGKKNGIFKVSFNNSTIYVKYKDDYFIE
jgi:hypothetical protein